MVSSILTEKSHSQWYPQRDLTAPSLLQQCLLSGEWAAGTSTEVQQSQIQTCDILISGETLHFWVSRGLFSDPVSTLGARRGIQIWSLGPEEWGIVLMLTVVPRSEVTMSCLPRGS